MEENNFNQNNPLENSTENQSYNTPKQEEVHTKSIGPIIGIAIILVIIIFGGLYYWGGKINNVELKQQQENLTAEDIINQEDSSLELLQAQSTSDEIVDIEADIDLTNLDNLDAELGNINTELGL